MSKEELKNKILKEYENGNIVLATMEGLSVAKIDDFIKQSTTGILYDLNRLPEVVLSFLDDPKWVNDYAVAMVISKLKARISELEKMEISKDIMDFINRFHSTLPLGKYELPRVTIQQFAAWVKTQEL